jgi:endonuclease-3
VRRATASARRKRFVPPASRAKGAADPARVAEVVARLRREIPEASCALSHESPFELLVATILSAQCTDARVNQVTPVLFERFPTPAALAAARRQDVEQVIRSTGFFRQKAKAIQGVAAAVARRGGVPDRLEELVTLPGVGRKTANVVLGTAFGRPAMVVDTHVSRLSRRLGWTRSDDPVRIEQDLVRILPERDWTFMGHALILHGRRTCASQRPRCAQCLLSDLCPSSTVVPARSPAAVARARGRS